MGKTTREYAIDVIDQVMEQDVHCDTALHQVFRQGDFTQNDKNYIKRIAYGTIERCMELDYMINQVSKTKVRKMKPLVRTVLRLGTYELKYMEQVPASATCNEMVKIVKRRKMAGLSGFVNGVLRNISRQMPMAPEDDLSIRYSIPQWIVEHLKREVGEDKLEQVLAGLFGEAGVTLRINTDHIKPEEYVKMLTDQGVNVESGAYLPYALRITGACNPATLPDYQDGLFVVQDESSMLPVALSGIQKEDMVLDLCAAPGGKTIHAASELSGTGHVYAGDVSEYKVDKIKENIARMGYKNVIAKVQDATEFVPQWEEKMDVVIADVPCSGLGIIGKKPDIKYHVKEESLVSLVKLQRRILDNAMRYVRPGGVLMYSTCTVNRGENMDQVNYILDSKRYELKSVREDVPNPIQVIPGIHKSDGFFVARFICKKA